MEMHKISVPVTGHNRSIFNSPKTQVEIMAEASMEAIDVKAISRGNVLKSERKEKAS